ncbi:type IV pilin protein [methane-oxidizing endosymbiont of Gigantopelta aegis]|uniref:type IV pilin protein n=1 Tax=methane-oxidizing endosymbiont of Gigantopelta aegis TaxID=2794938 RepID=UPI003CC92308
MIAVAIVGILASIVYPSYQSYITKSKEAAAQAALVSFASAMSQYYMEDMSYKGAAGTQASPTDTGTPWIFSDQVPLDSGTKTYDLTIDSATDATFKLKATPVDSSWRTFCIDEQGIKDDCNGTNNWD